MPAQGRQGDLDVDAGVGAGPVGHHLGADEQLAALLERVVEPLRRGAVVLRAALLAEGLQHRGDGGGALGGQVAGEAPGAVHGGVELQEPVLEAFAGRVLVGVLGAPGLVGGLGDDPQPVQVRPRPRGLEQDPVGVALQVLVADPAGPGGHLPRPRDRDRPARGGLVEEGVAGPAGASGGRRPWRPCAPGRSCRPARRRCLRTRRRRGRCRRRTAAAARSAPPPGRRGSRRPAPAPRRTRPRPGHGRPGSSGSRSSHGPRAALPARSRTPSRRGTRTAVRAHAEPPPSRDPRLGSVA